MTYRISLSIHDRRWTKAMAAFLSQVATETLKEMDHSRKDNVCTEVGLILTADKEMRQLNKQYRGKDKSTNVLSFADLDAADETTDFFLLGDVVLSYDDVQQESPALSKTFKAHAAHLVIHGVLHLLGYDHIRDKDADIMEKKECQLLANLPVLKNKTL